MTAPVRALRRCTRGSKFAVAAIARSRCKLGVRPSVNHESIACIAETERSDDPKAEGFQNGKPFIKMPLTPPTPGMIPAIIRVYERQLVRVTLLCEQS